MSEQYAYNLMLLATQDEAQAKELQARVALAQLESQR